MLRSSIGHRSLRSRYYIGLPQPVQGGGLSAATSNAEQSVNETTRLGFSCGQATLSQCIFPSEHVPLRDC